MFDELLKYAKGHRANMPAGQSRFDDMLGVANAGDENLCGEIIVFIDRQDLSNEFHAIGTDVVQSAYERRHAPCPGFGGQ